MVAYRQFGSAGAAAIGQAPTPRRTLWPHPVFTHYTLHFEILLKQLPMIPFKKISFNKTSECASVPPQGRPYVTLGCQKMHTTSGHSWPPSLVVSRYCYLSDCLSCALASSHLVIDVSLCRLSQAKLSICLTSGDYPGWIPGEFYVTRLP